MRAGSIGALILEGDWGEAMVNCGQME
jgi:hypothetical protein